MRIFLKFWDSYGTHMRKPCAAQVPRPDLEALQAIEDAPAIPLPSTEAPAVETSPAIQLHDPEGVPACPDPVQPIPIEAVKQEPGSPVRNTQGSTGECDYTLEQVKNWWQQQIAIKKEKESVQGRVQAV